MRRVLERVDALLRLRRLERIAYFAWMALFATLFCREAGVFDRFTDFCLSTPPLSYLFPSMTWTTLVTSQQKDDGNHKNEEIALSEFFDPTSVRLAGMRFRADIPALRPLSLPFLGANGVLNPFRWGADNDLVDLSLLSRSPGSSRAA